MKATKPHPLFAESPYQELRAIKVICEGMDIILKGQVSSFYLKQMASQRVKKTLPAFKLLNQLVVASRKKVEKSS